MLCLHTDYGSKMHLCTAQAHAGYDFCVEHLPRKARMEHQIAQLEQRVADLEAAEKARRPERQQSMHMDSRAVDLPVLIRRSHVASGYHPPRPAAVGGVPLPEKEP